MCAWLSRRRAPLKEGFAGVRVVGIFAEQEDYPEATSNSAVNPSA